MSRSRRRTPIIGIAGSRHTSEKQDKKIWHAAFRAKNRAFTKRLVNDRELEEIEPHFRDVSNPWSFTKDGKQWIGARNASWRKDWEARMLENRIKEMRK